MYDKTCCSADCPKTADRSIRGLCELWYPYGGKQRCQKTLDNWIKQDEKIAEMHEEYLKRGQTNI